MNCCQIHLKTCFRNRLMFIVIAQDLKPTKIILYNKFQQTLVKKWFLIEELLFGQMQNKTSKINLIISSTNSTDHFCYCNRSGRKIYFQIHPVRFLVKINPLDLSCRLRFFTCVVCSVTLDILYKGNWSNDLVVISGLIHCYMCLCFYFHITVCKYYWDASLCWGTVTR